MLQSLANACGMALQQPKLCNNDDMFEAAGCHRFAAALDLFLKVIF